MKNVSNTLAKILKFENFVCDRAKQILATKTKYYTKFSIDNVDYWLDSVTITFNRSETSDCYMFTLSIEILEMTDEEFSLTLNK